jgi:hypothetical protein
VTSLREGEILVIPGGWRTTETEGHAIVYLLAREQQSFSFTICNTGHGMHYHYARAEVAPPKLKRSLAIRIDKIPLYRLCDSSFWYMLYRPLVYPDPSNGPAIIYEVLLPYLNNLPLGANALEQVRDTHPGVYMYVCMYLCIYISIYLYIYLWD